MKYHNNASKFNLNNLNILEKVYKLPSSMLNTLFCMANVMFIPIKKLNR